MPSKATKARNYKKEHEANIKRLSEEPGGIDAERERVKLAQRKRRRDEGLKKREREYERKRRENPEYLARSRKLTREWRDRLYCESRDLVAEWKRHGCCVCGESALCCIDAHHKKQHEKEYTIGVLVHAGKPLKVVRDELEKCIPICSNCHRKYHDGQDADVVRRVEEITGEAWEPIRLDKMGEKKTWKAKQIPFRKVDDES